MEERAASDEFHKKDEMASKRGDHHEEVVDV